MTDVLYQMAFVYIRENLGKRSR